jgi:hypothetical protein
MRLPDAAARLAILRHLTPFLALRPATDDFLAAAEAVRANKERYARAEAHVREQRPQRPVYYDIKAGRV